MSDEQKQQLMALIEERDGLHADFWTLSKYPADPADPTEVGRVLQWDHARLGLIENMAAIRRLLGMEDTEGAAAG